MIDKVLENLRISSLNEMQLASLNAFQKGGDVLLLSPTGSGKTLGFLLPALTAFYPQVVGVQTLVLVPSRELALQIEQVFRNMGTGFKVNCCYGGHPMKTEKNNLEQPPTILIGTPGRIAAHIRRASFNTATINTLILDEFDKSLEFGFQEDMSYIINELGQLKQRMLTSATKMVTIPDFAGVKNPTELNFLQQELVQGLLLKTVISPDKDKLATLLQLICTLANKATLVFCNHRESVDRISDFLWDKGVANGVFHGGMEQEDREKTLIKFRNGTYSLIITTDLASRGLDIPEIANIIHYQLPSVADVFIHRNGRTARMNAKGTAYLLLSENEKLPSYINEAPPVESLSKQAGLPVKSEWSTLYIGGGKKNKINKTDIVGLLLQKGKLQKEELGLIEVLDFCAFAAVKSEKIKSLVQLIRDEKIKKKTVKIEIAN